jgi:hypothetical protein
MADDKTKTGGPDRRQVASNQPCEVEDFHLKHKHLSHDECGSSEKPRAIERKRTPWPRAAASRGKPTLIQRYGPDKNMVDLRLELAEGCPKIAANQSIDLCGVSYPDRIG